MSRLLPILVLLSLLVWLSGCEGADWGWTPVSQDKQAAAESGESSAGADADEADKEEDPELKRAQRAHKLAKLERDLGVAERKLAKARQGLEHQQAKDTAGVQQATEELAIAREKLQDFMENKAPVRREQAQLEVRRARDYLTEAEEELQQLEMMYSEDDLADKTKEIVINRSKRRLERQRWYLRIQEQELQNLEQQTLPLEERDLRLTEQQKANALEEAQRAANAHELEKMIAIISAEAEIEHLKAQIVEHEMEKDEEKEKE